MHKQTIFTYSLSCLIVTSNLGMHLTKIPSNIKKKFIRTVIKQSPELDTIRQQWHINNTPQEAVDISQGKIRIKEEVPHGKRYGVCHNYAFTKLMGIVGKPKILNILGQKDYYAGLQANKAYGVNILEFFDIVDGKSMQPGDIAMYIADNKEENFLNRIMHTGIVVGDDCIESKWGPISAVFEHPIWYVPAQFGNHIIYNRLNIEKSRLLEVIQERLNQESVKETYAECAHKHQQELFDRIKQYEQDKSSINGSKIFMSLEYDMNVHLDVPDENGITPLMHAERIGCEDLKDFFAAYQQYSE
jgi:hypothetical protein